MKFLFYLSVMSLLSFYACAQSELPSMSVEELKNKMKGNDVIILDVRTDAELSGPLGKIDGIVHIPLQELNSRISEMEEYKDKEIAVICRTGNRSSNATSILLKEGYNAKNVIGGMTEYREKETK